MRGATNPPMDSSPHVELLLPWYVNGSLDGAESRRVDRHLADCPQCRASHTLEERIVTALRQRHATLECAPQSGWNRLAARLFGNEMSGAARQQAVARQTRQATPREPQHPRRRLLAAAVLAQAGVIAALGFALAQLPGSVHLPQYRTLTEVGAPLPPGRSYLRVVFAADATHARIREILMSIEGTVRAGPTAQDVYTVELQALRDGAPPSAERAAAWLRHQPEVLFAESVGGPHTD